MSRTDLLQLAPGTEAPPLTGGKAGQARPMSGRLELSVTSDLASLASDWRQFETHADCTVFQCYGWLAAWARHIGPKLGAAPAVVVGRLGHEIVLILPLAVAPHALGRRLTFLGRDLCDYNAPLLAFDFHKRFSAFRPIWEDIQALLQADATYRHDVVFFDKMPERVGVQPNPLLQLPVKPHPSQAYSARLAGDWDTFYAAKRSAATRRRDRSKRKRLAESGEVRLATSSNSAEAAAVFAQLMAQKSRAFARMGVPDLFARPGVREFFMDIVTGPATRGLAHVSSLQVGEVAAATNLGLCFRGVYYHVLASYDDGPLARFGPGAAHLHELMRYAIEQGYTQFDFTIGDESYKRDWCDAEMELYDHAAAASLRGRVGAAALSGLRAVKRTIKRSERLWPLALKLRAGAGALKRRLSGRA